ncbi:tetratricopeptide repeat protein [Brevibacillus sp. SYSU BS000544]|uniref:tetratricopeptide repeat protein n=1 Tax=Brevibacillus sp. SYSU BS000544 TaxID=3416443 RepID=UPI003CE5AF44
MFNNYVGILIAATILLFTIGCSGEKNPDTTSVQTDVKVNETSEVVNNATTLINQGNLGDAQKLLEDALVKEPENGAYHYYIGNIYRKQENLDKALEYYLTASKKDSSLKEAYNNAAAILLVQQNISKAEEVINEGLSKHAEYQELIMKKGMVLYIQQKYQDCITTLEGMASDVVYFDASRFVGLSYLQLNKKAEAAKYLKIYLETAPDGLNVKEEIRQIYQGISK